MIQLIKQVVMIFRFPWLDRHHWRNQGKILINISTNNLEWERLKLSSFYLLLLYLSTFNLLQVKFKYHWTIKTCIED